MYSSIKVKVDDDIFISKWLKVLNLYSISLTMHVQLYIDTIYIELKVYVKYYSAAADIILKSEFYIYEKACIGKWMII